MLIRHIILLIIMALGLSACGTTPQQCQETDWLQLGMDDGFSGAVNSYSDDLKSSCEAQGFTKARIEYDAGFLHSQKQYCAHDWAGLAHEYDEKTSDNLEEFTLWKDTEQGEQVYEFCRAIGIDLEGAYYKTDRDKDAEYCAHLDWFRHGYNAAKKGRQQNVLRDIPDECEEFDIYLNAYDYELGHTAGAEQFCTFDKGFDLASKGLASSEICNGKSYFDYTYGRVQGLKSAPFVTQIKALKKRNRLLRSEINQISLSSSEASDKIKQPESEQSLNLAQEIAENIDRIKRLEHLVDELRY